MLIIYFSLNFIYSFFFCVSLNLTLFWFIIASCFSTNSSFIFDIKKQVWVLFNLLRWIFLSVLCHFILQGGLYINAGDISKTYKITENISNFLSNMNFLFFRESLKPILNFSLPLEYLWNFAHLTNKSEHQIARSMIFVPVSLPHEHTQHHCGILECQILGLGLFLLIVGCHFCDIINLLLLGSKRNYGIDIFILKTYLRILFFHMLSVLILKFAILWQLELPESET